MRTLAGLALVLALRAQAAPHRQVAVLEFRGGVEQAAAIGERLAEQLAKSAALRIVGPIEARQKSPQTDAAVASCAGDATCLARLGRELQVDEILLVGVSKLGDLVLALQRIDVGEGRAIGQLSQVLADPEVSDELLLSWLHQLYPPDVFKRYGFIVVTANLAGATVTVNGQGRGETPLEEKLTVLAPRIYRVELTRPGYIPFEARIEVPPDGTVEVRAELQLQTPPVRWYNRWYVWAITGAVVAGAAAGAMAYALQPDRGHVEGFVQR